MIPPRRILVGVDFSECSRAALNLAARFTLHTGSGLYVLHVLDPTLIKAAGATDLRAEAAEELRRFVGATPPAAACHPETFVICGSPGTVLCDIAAREQADILVVGAHGLCGTPRWLFGANTERALRRARMSVLVVPSGWRPPQSRTSDLSGMGPVIAAVDFTPPAFTAAFAAARIARLLQARFTVLHVIPELHVIDRWISHANGAAMSAAHAARLRLDTELSHVRAIAPMHLHVVTGDIVGSILRASEPQNSDAPLLVLGRRPQEEVDSPPGSVVSRALASLRVPMLVVHPSEGGPGA